ncbi:EAL domain-containing protein [Shewanella sp. Isolate11]|uniref:EAL domain-containing protein n=1 Tax=Shewanella sp. Isolate11 TaxID=2908530 RepID=UPI001EFCCFFD|nr:EAL domain-containing protein [Shewanella sp. Isolate11]MCG9696297.1 EAL domain-containing protein [Shewanella sp. Isolate11]
MPKILTTLVTIVMLAITLTGQVFASEPLLKVDHFNVAEGLSQSTVTSVVEDQYGFIWLGTLNGLNRFDGKKFKHYYSNNKNSLPSSFIRSLFIDNNNRLLVGTDKGLVVYNPESEKFDQIKTIKDIQNTPIWSISQTNKKLYIGTENTVIIVNNDSFEVEEEIKTEISGIKKIIPFNNKLFIRTYNGIILKIEDSKAERVENADNIAILNNNIVFFKDGLALDEIRENKPPQYTSISQNENGAYSYSNNLLYKTDENGTYAIGEIPLENVDISKPDIYIGSNNIFLTSQNNGVIIVNKKQNTLKTYSIDHNIWSLSKLNNKSLLITSDSEYISVYDKDLNKLESYNSGVSGPKTAVSDIKHIYAGTANGLISIDIMNRNTEIINNSQFFVVKKFNNILVAGTLNGKIIKINLKNGKQEEISIDPGNPIYDIILFHEDQIMVASQGGLFHIYENQVRHIFKDDLVTNLHYKNGEILFGTRSSLLSYNIKNDEVTQLISTNKPIYSIGTFEDSIIAASNSEIIFISKDRSSTTFSSNYGSQSEYNTQSIVRIDDMFYIGGFEGVTKLSVKKITDKIKSSPLPATFLDEILIFNVPQEVGSQTLNKGLSFSNKLYLRYSDYPFTLKFVTPGNLDSSLEYSYQMQGLSDTWIGSKGNDSATYTNLSPGEYTFKVHAIDPLTNKPGPTKSIDIEITPPWWLSLSAKLVYLSIVIVISAIMIKAFLRRQEVQRQIAKSEERLKLSLWGSGDEMWDWDIETGQIYRSNIWGSLEFPRDGQRSGESGEESNIHPMDQERVNTALNNHFYGVTDHFEAAYRVKGKDDQWVWILDRAKIVERDENDKALRMTGTIKNISNFKQAEEQLRLFERAIENISEGMFILDNQFHFVEVNTACCDLSIMNRDEFIGNILKFSLYPPSYSQQIRTILQQQGSWSDEVEASKGDGSSFLMELTIDAIYDEQGVLTHYVGVFSDISRRKRQEEELRKLTNNDLLTNLPNRSSLMVTLGNLVKKDIHHTLMVLDLDNFKKINDSLGHQVGDELLIKVSRRIESTIPSHTTIYRLGGDEFAILIDNNPDIGSSAVIANNVVDAFSQPFELTNDRVVVGVSIGIVLYPEDDQNEQALLRKADIAMYHAKSAGGNRYQFYSESLNKNAIRQLEVENLIREGLRDDRFEVHYQPKIDLKTGKMAGMEALVRLNHPEHGLISPGEFIPLAEENGLIVEIGEVVLRKACFAAQNWRQQGLFNGRVAVNLSSLQFALPDLEQRIASILRLTQLPAANLELEITEGTVIKQPEKAIKVMMQLSKMGVSLALDDFGTGYSSLSYLKRFPIDTLKIDKAFVDDIDKSDRDLKMVDSIITIAHNMGLSVVGEGVEDASQLSILKALKCEEIQGFIYSKAVCEQDFSLLLKQDFIPAHSLKKAK